MRTPAYHNRRTGNAPTPGPMAGWRYIQHIYNMNWSCPMPILIELVDPHGAASGLISRAILHEYMFVEAAHVYPDHSLE